VFVDNTISFLLVLLHEPFDSLGRLVDRRSRHLKFVKINEKVFFFLPDKNTAVVARVVAVVVSSSNTVVECKNGYLKLANKQPRCHGDQHGHRRNARPTG
jgi:hypothetical protein